jgi:BirA family transcriptional regulator, biotin operon repressor / biotin---[acetyl-CoA-carboxylase] ligase
MASDGLAEALQALPRHWHGHYFEAIDSTQDEARAAARLGAPSRSIFVADFQRAGRGRQGRSWLAGPGDALMLSIIFRESATPPTPWRWTSLASVALAESFQELLPTLAPAIKWPNDVLLNDRKVAGILAETTSDGQQLVAVVGVGVNVHSDEATLAPVGGTATSLRIASGLDIDRGQLLVTFLRQMDTWLARPWPELHAAWQARLWGRGQRLRLLDLGREEEVVVLGAELDGSLRVRLADGTERHTTTGELIL